MGRIGAGDDVEAPLIKPKGSGTGPDTKVGRTAAGGRGGEGAGAGAATG